MARSDALLSLFLSTKEPMELNFELMTCRFKIEQLLSITDIMDIHTIVNSVRYMGNAEKRVSMINDLMKRRNFRKFHAGTNRTVYVFLDDTGFVCKVPIDKNGEEDNLAENKNQWLIKPFCTRMFQTTQFGTVSFSERVQPITSREEYLSIANEVFNLIVYKILGKYVVDDIGSTRFMNIGIRTGWGPVLLDYPKVFELDGNKLKCTSKISGHICNGDIDFDDGFDILKCKICGAEYTAKELGKSIKEGKVKIIKPINNEGGSEIMKVTFMRGSEILSVRDFDNPPTSTYEKREDKSFKNIESKLVIMNQDEEVNNEPEETMEQELILEEKKEVEETTIPKEQTKVVFKATTAQEYKEEVPDTVYQTDPGINETFIPITNLDKICEEEEFCVDNDITRKLQVALDEFLAKGKQSVNKYNSLPESLRKIQDNKTPPKVKLTERIATDKTRKIKMY